MVSSESVSKDHLLQYDNVVKCISYSIWKKLPANVRLDDLIQNGWLGLIEADRKYDSSSNVKFSTYAGHKIRGAILDYLRRDDWLTRRYREALARDSSLVEPTRCSYNERTHSVDYDSCDDLLNSVCRSADSKLLDKAIASLPKRLGEVIRLKFWHGFSDYDLGKRFKIRQSRAGQLRRDALEKLTQYFENIGVSRKDLVM